MGKNKINNKKMIKSQTKESCLNLIKILNNKKNSKNMEKCYYNILKISKLFPPAKNENKFIYGKLIELQLIKTFNHFFICNDLDKNHKYGSEYKNDCEINGNKFSIKASKNTSNVIILNKHNKSYHKIDTNFIICNIEKKKLYIFPSLIIKKEYIINKESHIYFKSSLFKYLEKNNNNYIYDFPELIKESKKKIEDVKEVNIYQYLYKTFL
jgi:hypothetical protein